MTATADNELFEEVSVVTLKSDFLHTAYDIAFDLLAKSKTPSPKQIEQTALRLIENHKVPGIGEYVRVSDYGITIGINAESITDDVIWRALTLLSRGLEQLDGKLGVVQLGPIFTFDLSEISWLHRH